MSRFFNANSSSESETDSDNEVDQQPRPRVTATKIQTYESDDDDNDKARVVLPEKARRSEEINGLIKQLKNSKKIRDIVKTNEIFEDMVKAYDKCKKLIENEGHLKQYIRAIAELETSVEELWKDTEWKKSASKNNASSLSKLRQRIRKYNKDYETEIADFKKNPNNYPDEEKVADAADGSDSEKSGDESSSEEDSSEDSDDDDEKPAKKVKQPKPAKGDDDEDDDDSSDWSSSEEDSESDSDIDYTTGDVWRVFLKDKDQDGKPKKEKKRKDKKVKETRQRDESVESTTKAEKPKLFAKDEEINHESVVNKLNQICSGRGRKGTDRKIQIEMMNELREISRQKELGPAVDVKIVFNQIAVNFDYNPRLNKCMKNDNWKQCLQMLEDILETLLQNNNIELSEEISDETENFSDKTQNFRIKGCVLTMTDRMCEEFVKILQQCDAHGSEYVDRLKDEPKISSLIDRLQTYVERKSENKQELCRVYLKKVEHLYYKYDKNNEKGSAQVVDRLCKYIYTNDITDRLRTKAMLLHIYHNALHDRWFEARDLMLMSHLQESIDNADIPLQILYNRMMVQVGLCAFRVGNIKESHAALLDIQIGNRAKELLAQGMMVQKNVEKTKEQEMKERQRLIPFHMHINLELIECVYLVSAMLIEIPFMCSRDYETKKRLISKQFHYQLKYSERQPVVGPPENMREHVVAASRAMKNGDWKACIKFLINEKMNAKVWDLMPQSSNVKQMLNEKVKEESLRTYLFRFSAIYESISIQVLAEMFALPQTQCYSIISKMIINEELMASLDEPTQTVVMHRTEPTKLQTLAMQLSEKISNLMDHTERMMTAKGGEMSTFLTRNQQGQQSHNNQNQQHQRGDGQGHRGEHGQNKNWNKQNKYYDNNKQNRPPRNNQNQDKNHHNNQHHQQSQKQQQY